ncbi:hypothetical protein XaC1_242 [Xanthomonas phage XaC1]|nr:hypothetical protein XaC1_242 [Xanthomonas phage XaC1]
MNNFDKNFLKYLNANVPEFNSFVQKYGKPSVSSIKRLIAGDIIKNSFKTERQTVVKKEIAYFTACHGMNVPQFISNVQEILENAERSIRSENNDFKRINGITMCYNSAEIEYEVLEDMHTFNIRTKDIQRNDELNALAPLLKKGLQDFQTSFKENINEIRKKALKEQIESMQKELQELESN